MRISDWSSDVCSSDLLDQHLAGEAADTHLEAIQVLDGLDFLTEPAAHLRAGVAGHEVDAVVALEELAHQLHAAAEHHPGILLAPVQDERDGGVEGESRVLADTIGRASCRERGCQYV